MSCCLLPDGTMQGTCLRLGCNLCRACQGARPAGYHHRSGFFPVPLIQARSACLLMLIQLSAFA